jgi:excisionase family DNA binding protein
MPKTTDFTVPEAAKRLGVSKQYLYRIIAEGKLTPRAVLKHELRITEVDVQELSQRRQARKAASAGAAAR